MKLKNLFFTVIIASLFMTGCSDDNNSTDISQDTETVTSEISVTETSTSSNEETNITSDTEYTTTEKDIPDVTESIESNMLDTSVQEENVQIETTYVTNSIYVELPEDVFN